MDNFISKQAERLSWLDVLRGLGIILVAIGHIYSNKTVFNWLYSFHMPLFFFAAGWVYKQKPILADIKRRIQTIVVPYFAFGLLGLVYWQLIERQFRSSDMSFLSSFFGLLSGQYDYLDFNVHLWFLPCFFVTVIFYNVLVNLGGKKLAWIVSTIMSAAFVFIPLPGLPWGIDRVFKYIGFYAVGHAISSEDVEKRIKEKSIGFNGLICFILIALNFVLSYFGLYKGVLWFVTALIGVAGVFIISFLINENKLLQYFGRISLIVLCIHGPVYRVLIKLVSIPLRVSTDAARSNFLIAMIVVALTLIICAFVYEAVIRIAPWAVGKKKRLS